MISSFLLIFLFYFLSFFHSYSFIFIFPWVLCGDNNTIKAPKSINLASTSVLTFAWHIKYLLTIVFNTESVFLV